MVKKILLAGIFVLGCAAGSERWTADKVNFIEVGMTKEQIIAILGKPTSSSAIKDTAYLSYMLRERHKRGWQSFYVRLVDNKVESFGRKGDFDSTKIPETKNTIDLNIKHK